MTWCVFCYSSVEEQVERCVILLFLSCSQQIFGEEEILCNGAINSENSGEQSRFIHHVHQVPEWKRFVLLHCRAYTRINGRYFSEDALAHEIANWPSKAVRKCTCSMCYHREPQLPKETLAKRVKIIAGASCTL